MTGASSYNLYFGTAPGVTKSSTKLAGVTSPYSHTGLTGGQVYYYAVSAVKGGLESALSNELSGTALTAGILDQVAGTNLGGWSTSRGLLAGYTAALRRWHRSTDNAEHDFGQVAQVFDAAGATAWLGSANAKEAKQYDQTGGGNDLSYSDAAYLWKTANAGVPVAGPNGRWAIDDASNIGVLDSPNSIVPASAWWFYWVGKIQVLSSAVGFIFCSKNNTYPALYTYSDSYRLIMAGAGGGAQLINNAVGAGTWLLAIGVFNGASSRLIVNGSEADGAINASAADYLRLGADGNGSENFAGQTSEFVMFGGTPSAGQITAIQNNVAAFFGSF